MATPLYKSGGPAWLEAMESDVESQSYKRSIRYYKKLFAAWVDWGDAEKVANIYRESKRRRKRGEDVHVDHMVPISHPYVCGLHNEFNLQIITELENLKKSNNWWPDMWDEQIDMLPAVEPYQLRLL